jgi:hypothetical protein
MERNSSKVNKTHQNMIKGKKEGNTTSLGEVGSSEEKLRNIFSKMSKGSLQWTTYS